MSQSAVRSVVRLVRSPVLTEEAAVFEFRLSRKFPDLSIYRGVPVIGSPSHY